MDYTLHTTFPQDLQGEWNALLEETPTHVPFLRHEYLAAWTQTRGGGEWRELEVAVVTARQDGRLAGIAPLFLDRSTTPPRLMLLGSIEISDYLDLLASPADLQPFVDGLLPFLASAIPGWGTLDLYNLLEDSPTLAALETAARRMGWGYAAGQISHAPTIHLPGDWETYLAGIDKKQRHEIRRKMRRLEESGVPARWYIVQDAAGLEGEIDAFLALMEQDPAKAAFLTPAMRQQMRLALRCAFAEGCLQLAFLEINGRKAAAYLSFDYLNRLWIYNSGLDRSFMEYSPGWVLLGYLLKWANENQRTEFDFMRGDEDYKYRFGAVDRFVLRAVVTR